MKLQNSFKFLFFLFFLFFSCNSFGKESINDRVKKLTLELRCMTCQNQSVHDSDSDYSKDIKQELHPILDGLTEYALNYFKDSFVQT